MSQENLTGPAAENIARLVGDMESLYPDSFDAYVKIRSLRGASEDYNNIDYLANKKAVIIFVANTYHAQTSPLPIDLELTSLIDESFFMAGMYAVRPDQLPEQDTHSTQSIVRNHTEISPKTLEVWLKYADFYVQTSGSFRHRRGFDKAYVSSVDGLFISSFQNIIFKAKTKSMEYHYMGPSDHDNKVGVHSTNLKTYHKLLEPILETFTKNHKEIVKKYSLQQLQESLINKARAFEGRSYDEPA